MKSETSINNSILLSLLAAYTLTYKDKFRGSRNFILIFDVAYALSFPLFTLAINNPCNNLALNHLMTSYIKTAYILTQQTGRC